MGMLGLMPGVQLRKQNVKILNSAEDMALTVGRGRGGIGHFGGLRRSAQG